MPEFDNLKKLLFDSSSRTIQMVANTAGNKPVIFSDLLSLSLKQIPKYSQRASRVVVLIAEENPELIKSYLPEIIWSFPELKDDSVKRAFLSILMNVPDIRDEELLAILINYCFRFLESNESPVAVKVYAMEVLYNISRKVPEIIHELIAVLEEQVRKGSPALKVTGERKLKKLYKEV